MLQAIVACVIFVLHILHCVCKIENTKNTTVKAITKIHYDWEANLIILCLYTKINQAMREITSGEIMFILTTVTIKQEDMKPAIASYNKLDKLTVSAEKIGPMVKVDENDNTIRIITLYDIKNNSYHENDIKTELSNRIEQAKKLIPSAVGRLEVYKSFEEFLIPLVGKNI